VPTLAWARTLVASEPAFMSALATIITIAAIAIVIARPGDGTGITMIVIAATGAGRA